MNPYPFAGKAGLNDRRQVKNVREQGVRMNSIACRSTFGLLPANVLK